MKQLIYFTGTLPPKGDVPFGGGEIGNVRTIKMLESFGYEVVTIRRLRSNAKDSKVKLLLTYPFRTLFNAMHWFFVLMFGSRKNSIAHISGFYGVTIYVETFQVFIAKLFKYRLIYELRGGGAKKYYENGSKFYRKQFLYIVNKADYLFSQGKENEPFLKSICKTPIFFYPNYVQNGFYPERMPDKNLNRINLLFFGRIEEAKNPELIVETAAILQKQFPNIRLTLVGNGQKEFLKEIRRKMTQFLLSGSYELLPGCEHDKLKSLLKDKHFFIFPSVQPREGQSNALTEVMSYGIIPIASPQGFNRSTVGDDRLIVEELKASAYAERIAEIIQNGEVEKYSRIVRQRFLENYTVEIVYNRTMTMYDSIFSGNH